MDLHAWDIFTVALVASFLANGALGVVILAVDPRRKLNRHYALMCLAIAHWSAMKLWMALSATAALAEFHFKASGLSWCILPALALHFVLVFVGKDRDPRLRLIVRGMYVMGAVLVVALWSGAGMLAGMHLGPHGYTDVPGPLYVCVFQPFLISGFVLAGVELARFARRTTARDDRRRALIVLSGFLFPVAGGAMTDMVLPSMGIFVFELAIPLTTLNAALIAFAMVHYGLMSITAEHAATTIISTMCDTLLVLDPRGRIQLVNPATVQLLDYKHDELIGMNAAQVVRADALPETLRARVEQHGALKLEVVYVTKHGEEIPVDLSVSRLKDRSDRTLGFVCVGKDIRAGKMLIAELQAAKQDLQELAVTDDLTGLFNRRYLARKLREELLRARRFSQSLSLVIVDLDHFKQVNDTFGHDEGDAVLRMVAEAIRASIRSIDTAARFGGDEFVVLLPGTGDDDALQVGERIREGIGAEEATEPARLVTASVGVATLEVGDSTTDEVELFRMADHALLEAKRRGKDCVVHNRDAPLMAESARVVRPSFSDLAASGRDRTG